MRVRCRPLARDGFEMPVNWIAEIETAQAEQIEATRHDAFGALDEQRALASMLKTVLVAYDKLFNLSFPYMMVLHQRPTDGDAYDHYHFHIEFYPPLRTATKLKYLAGSETGAGMYINDTLAEEKAAELRERVEPVVWQTKRAAGTVGSGGDESDEKLSTPKEEASGD